MSDKTTYLRDRTQRFLFENADIRGEIVQLQGAYRDVIDLHQYAPGVSRLLGEFMAAAVLLATTLKFEGKLVLQVRSEGQVPLLMAECDSSLNIRAIARGAEQATAERFDQLLPGGTLAITIDPTRGQRYQGIVAVSGRLPGPEPGRLFPAVRAAGNPLLAGCRWCRGSGHAATATARTARENGSRRHDQWEHACTLAATVQEQELLDLAAPELFHRLYHQDPAALVQPKDGTL